MQKAKAKRRSSFVIISNCAVALNLIGCGAIDHSSKDKDSGIEKIMTTNPPPPTEPEVTVNPPPPEKYLASAVIREGETMAECTFSETGEGAYPGVIQAVQVMKDGAAETIQIRCALDAEAGIVATIIESGEEQNE